MFRRSSQHWFLMVHIVLAVAWVWAYASSAQADNQPGTDMARLIQANEKQAVALEKIVTELQGIKRQCK